MQLTRWTSQTCTNVANSWSLDLVGTCDVTVTGTANQWWSASAPVIGTCAPTETVTLPEPAFVSDHALCSPRSTPSCGAGTVCVPAVIPPFEALCIFKQGDEQCPPSPYSERIVYHTDFDDSRGCSECECGDPNGVCTGINVQLHGNDSCSMLASQVAGTGNCVQVAPTSTAARTFGSLEAPEADCVGVATQTEPTGTVTPANPVTVCCLP
jgi:hypothetical protein